jgi:hypothetical protein
MGLGDDRKDGAPKNGRDGTMMVGGVPGVDVNVVQKIDKNLIDRLGMVIERYLEDQGKELPECQAWNGSIRSTTQVTMNVSGVTIECNGEENGTVTLAIVDDAVSGTLDASGSVTCTGPVSTSTEPTAVAIRVTGTLEDGAFRLKLGRGGQDITGSYTITPPCVARPFEIPVARRTGSVELIPGDLVAPWTVICNITVERQSDDEPVG